MKKTYTAPVMLAENFRLSDRIAAGCSPDALVNLRNGEACEKEYMEGTNINIFMQTNGDCWIWYDPNDPPSDQPCYHAPTSAWKYFSS